MAAKKERKLQPWQTLKPIKKKKHLFLKGASLIAFVLSTDWAVKKYFSPKPLPYDDTQPFPSDNSSLENLEMTEALRAYDYLLQSLRNKAAQVGLTLNENFLLKTAAFDFMSQNINVILANNQNNTFAHLSFPSYNLTSEIELIDNSATMADQISSLTNVLNVPLKEMPYISKLNEQLSQSVNLSQNTSIKYYASTKELFSDGNVRDQLDEKYDILTGRDYYYVTLYGTGTNNGTNYDLETTISMERNAYEIAEVQNLASHYISNTTSEYLIVNTNLQESNQTLTKLNNELANAKTK